VTLILTETKDASPSVMRALGVPLVYDITRDEERPATQADIDTAMALARLGQQWMKAHGGPSSDLAAVARGEMSERAFTSRHLKQRS